MKDIVTHALSGIGSIFVFILVLGLFAEPREPVKKLPDPCKSHMTMVSHWKEPVKVMCWNQVTQEPRPCKK